MKKACIFILFLLFCAVPSFAQEVKVDSSLIGKSIFSIMPSEVRIHQPQSVANALASHVASNASRNMLVYRVRIFNDSRQSARNASENAENSFKNGHPNIPAYRTYSSPFFRVTVGDFRTKSEAMKLMAELSGEYSNMIIIKESTQYPLLNSSEIHSTNMDVERK